MELGNVMSGWIGVDLDGTLAHYEGGGIEAIGPPIPEMVERVRYWLAEGQDVRIFTARMSMLGHTVDSLARQHRMIRDWCKEHIGCELLATCCKDFAMVELWDDRAVQVIPNTGKRADGIDDGPATAEEIIYARELEAAGR